MREFRKLSEIKTAVSEVFNVDERFLSMKTRNSKIAKARHVYFYISSEYSTNSYTAIGKSVNRDHSTVSYAVKKIKIEKECDIELRVTISEIIDKLCEIVYDPLKFRFFLAGYGVLEIDKFSGEIRNEMGEIIAKTI